ncbi:hypothetical protein NGI02_07750 [Escherichia fergusonii]|uniref:hypothetical protein n=1 Tax=Escherichia TaxID=561 RepID=UPI00097227EB|nr:MULTISPECIES: hypothetical protein [Escherichia]EJH5705052.1 hypothetical protein [Escherichia coli]MEB8048144.1 hypothetical protein [Escherichia fergusonii]MEB8053620.1 hypothetical protein [Escherichia fergusonii]OMI53673.1 hypothetical protein MP34_07025 [Escherichia coli N37122PS]OMI62328.1 hypothetical protein EP55_00395 [Escherichia coli N37139PS]
MVKEFLVSKENKPSYECMNTAETCLGLAGMASEDWQREHHCRTGIIFTAFAIEAMFIFYRKQVDPGYDKTQKECRKTMHKNTLKLCGINNYMGTKPYQIIKECLEVRDAIAHGDSYTSSFNFSADHLDNQDDIAKSVLAVNSEQFRGLTVERLAKYIEMAKHIDHEISDNGYRHSEGYLPAAERRSLMLAFGVSGVSMWPSA